MSMPGSLFYGKRSQWTAEAIRLHRQEKWNKEHRIPTPYHPKQMLGPGRQWQVFHRQQDAFNFVDSVSQDLHVFAFESESFVERRGQRLYLASSYEQFYHYYSQLDEKKRMHYEVIPEGSPCHLYFDLEFNKKLNPTSDGVQMTMILIKYVIAQLHHLLEVQCDVQRVLQLDASTNDKFSRHLIFQLEKCAFHDNRHAGQFVQHICRLLLDTLKRHGAGQTKSHINHLTNQCGSDSSSSYEDSASCSQTLGTSLGIKPSTTEDSHQTWNSPASKCDSSSWKYQALHSTCSKCSLSQHSNTKSISRGHEKKADVNNARRGTSAPVYTQSCKKDGASRGQGRSSCGHHRWRQKHDASHCAQMCSASIDTRINSMSVGDVEKSVPCTEVDGKSCECSEELWNEATSAESLAVEGHASSCQDTDDGCLHSDAFLSSADLTLRELSTLLISTKDEQQDLFCDLGVYTKNRNFRLYLSSKLGKKAPLVLPPDRVYQPRGNRNVCQEQIFMDSLIANVRHSGDLKLLTFGDTSDAVLPTSHHLVIPSRNKQETLEGYQQSSYPAVDEFINSLLQSRQPPGVIRRWRYFQQGQLLLYDVARNRWCERIGRQHTSNNIMLVADLQRGIYYQKCHDPDCKAVQFKSPDYLLPESVICTITRPGGNGTEAGFTEMMDEELLAFAESPWQPGEASTELSDDDLLTMVTVVEGDTSAGTISDWGDELDENSMLEFANSTEWNDGQDEDSMHEAANSTEWNDGLDEDSIHEAANSTEWNDGLDEDSIHEAANSTEWNDGQDEDSIHEAANSTEWNDGQGEDSIHEAANSTEWNDGLDEDSMHEAANSTEWNDGQDEDSMHEAANSTEWNDGQDEDSMHEAANSTEWNDGQDEGSMHESANSTEWNDGQDEDSMHEAANSTEWDDGQDEGSMHEAANSTEWDDGQDEDSMHEAANSTEWDNALDDSSMLEFVSTTEWDGDGISEDSMIDFANNTESDNRQDGNSVLECSEWDDGLEESFMLEFAKSTENSSF